MLGLNRLSIRDAVSGGAVQIGELGPGECFGKSLTAGGAAEKISNSTSPDGPTSWRTADSKQRPPAIK